MLYTHFQTKPTAPQDLAGLAGWRLPAEVALYSNQGLDMHQPGSFIISGANCGFVYYFLRWNLSTLSKCNPCIVLGRGGGGGVVVQKKMQPSGPARQA